FGLTLIEAMSAGLPIVASNWDGYRDLVSDGDNGFLIPTYSSPPSRTWIEEAFYRAYAHNLAYLAQTTAIDLDVLVARLEQLVVSRAVRETMGRRARETAENRFAWTKIIASYGALWRRTCRSARWPGAGGTGIAKSLQSALDYGHVFA